MKQRGKKKKRIRTISDISGTMLNTPTFKSKESQRKKTKRKAMKNILEEIRVENFPKMEKEIVTQVQETQSPKQDKPKMKQPKTHINQINEDQTQRTNINSSKGKTTNTQGDPIRITADLSIETLQARREWQDILKVMKEKNLQPRLQ